MLIVTRFVFFLMSFNHSVIGEVYHEIERESENYLMKTRHLLTSLTTNFEMWRERPASRAKTQPEHSFYLSYRRLVCFKSLTL